VIRIAAIGDLHVGTDSRGLIGPRLSALGDVADVLLVAGDLTRVGTVDEIDVFVDELGEVEIPKIAVLGNHDHHGGCPGELIRRCERGGVTVLDGDATVVDVEGERLGVAGLKGFGGGFPGTSVSAFGEEEMKSFARESMRDAERLSDALATLDADRTVVLLHYAPVRDTISGEPIEIYPFLGSGLFAEVADAAAADLVIHGHAHHGTEHGITPGGVPVRNVAQPVINDCFRLIHLGADAGHSGGVAR
jgi:Icc-related predicted phosphoesterase